jgi:two-component system cell cycle response regulator DivK
MIKILLVEDHPELRDLLSHVLEWMGFTSITAKNGKEGVETALAEKPDLILMNGNMPMMDGWQATRLLRAKPETKNIPIIAATAMLQHRRFKGLLMPYATTTSSSYLRRTNS